jgi:hypothetical protein
MLTALIQGETMSHMIADWQAIATAPKSGRILLYGPHVRDGFYIEVDAWWQPDDGRPGCWPVTYMDGFGQPTHWAPRPIGPNAQVPRNKAYARGRNRTPIQQQRARENSIRQTKAGELWTQARTAIEILAELPAVEDVIPTVPANRRETFSRHLRAALRWLNQFDDKWQAKETRSTLNVPHPNS